jgi:hypothetical protein
MRMGFWDFANTIGTVIENSVEAFCDTVDDAAEVVTETVQETADAAGEITQDLDPTGGLLAAPVVLVAGIVSGAATAAGDLMHTASAFWAALGGALGALLRGDLVGAVGRLLDAVIYAFNTLGIALRFITAGYFIGAMKNQADKASLRRFVKRLLEEQFGDDADLLDRLLEKLGLLPFRLFRFPVAAEHRVMRMDSQTVDRGLFPLWQAHNNGDLDLYVMAGLAGPAWGEMFDRPETVVVEVDANGNEAFWPVTRGRIDEYLATEGAGVRLRVYAMTRRTAADRMDAARRKFKKMAIYLNWNDPLALAAFQRDSTVDIEVGEYMGSGTDANGVPFSWRYVHAYEFNFTLSDDFLAGHDLRSGEENERCQVLSCAAFKFYERKYYGMTLQGNHWVTYHRDSSPQYGFRYVLGHELGHYFGLVHTDGIDNMMYSPIESTWFPNPLHYWLNSEPTFTLDQAKASWDFIITEMRGCLTAL